MDSLGCKELAPIRRTTLEAEIRTRAVAEILQVVAVSLPPVWRERARLRLLERRQELAEIKNPQVRTALLTHLDELAAPFS